MEKICVTLKKYQEEKKERLSQICTKLKEFKRKKEQMKLRGFNDFNYISLLRGFYDENAHSRIIAEFLNPQGSHYQGTLFLENFFKILNISSFGNLRKWRVYTEWFVENCEGKGQGRIDILVQNGDRYVLIENKINAADQQAQIYKYVKCIKKNNISVNNIEVIYLSLDGHYPSSRSLVDLTIEGDYLVEDGEKVAKIKIISYENILEWMESNLKDIENISNLREAVKQYIKAVKTILKKQENIMNIQEYLMRNENRDILIEMIENYSKLPEMEDEECRKIIYEENVLNVLDEIAQELRKNVIEKIQKLIIEKLSDRFKIDDLGFGGKWSPLIVYKPDWKKCENNNQPLLHYAIELDKWNYRGLYYGIRKCDENIPFEKDNIPEILREKLNITNSNTTFWWLFWAWFEYPYNMDRISLKEKGVIKFYTELLKSYDDIDSFVIKHYIDPFIKYIEQTDNILDEYYKTL